MATAAAAPIAFATAGLSAASTVMKGAGDKAAADYKAARLEQSAQYGRLSAAQTEAQMGEDLNQNLGNIDAIRAAAGADPFSPTSVALHKRAEFVGDRQRTTTVNNILRQASQDEADANYMKQAGDYALKSSIVSAGVDLGKSAMKGF